MTRNQATPHPANPPPRRLEEAALNAWPALQQILLDGWVLRFSRGFTKRSNCIVPLYPGLEAQAEKIWRCENLYAKEAQPTVFRLISADPTHQQLDASLAEREYRQADVSLMMGTHLDRTTRSLSSSLHMLDLQAWLDTYCALTGMPEPAKTLSALIMRGISGECGFGVLRSAGRTVACGLAVLDRELVGLSDIFTDPSARGQGHGKAVVQALLAWAFQRGAAHAYLQCDADNTAAIGLYRALGFSERYRCWHRIER